MQIQTVSYSELDTLRMCILKWELQYKHRLSGGRPNFKLILGSAWHAVMEGHYSTFIGVAPADRDPLVARDAARDRLNAWATKSPDGQHVDEAMLETLRWMYAGYTERWGVDETWDVLEIEKRYEIPMLQAIGPDDRLWQYVFVAKIDLEVHDRRFDQILVVDHKSAGGRDASGEAWNREFAIDDQHGLYTAARRLVMGVKVFGSVHNVARTDRLKREMTPEERFGRIPVFRSDAELQALWDDAKAATEAIAEHRAGRRGTYSAPNPAECKWKCDFLEVHLAARARPDRPILKLAEDYGFAEHIRSPRFTAEAAQEAAAAGVT